MATLSSDALDQIFSKARTHNGFLDKAISDETLHHLYELAKWGPTSSNGSPARFVFIKSKEAKEKLISCAAAGNIEKIRSAPVTAIIAEDLEFYEKLKQLFPHADARSYVS